MCNTLIEREKIELLDINTRITLLNLHFANNVLIFRDAFDPEHTLRNLHFLSLMSTRGDTSNQNFVIQIFISPQLSQLFVIKITSAKFEAKSKLQKHAFLHRVSQFVATILIPKNP